MDAFSYHNIFETKGLEYLIIIAFLALLIPFSVILNSRVKSKRKMLQSAGQLTAGILKIPQGVFFSKNHMWAHLAKSGVASVGMDDMLLHFTGELTLNYLKDPGSPVMKGEVIAEAGQQGKILRITSPISGQVLQHNPALIENPEVLNEDPYGNGWIYRIKPSAWKAETGDYFLAGTATAWSGREVERFRDFLSATLPKYAPESAMVVMQDGGELRDHVMSELPEELWRDFQDEFLVH